jgi:hypothetical protein
MRYLFELAVFGTLAGIAFGVLFGVTWVAGLPFGLDPWQAALFAAVILCFWLPAFSNVYIAANGSGGESCRERAMAGIRAFGMLICSAVLTVHLVRPDLSWSLGVLVFLTGQVFWWGSCLVER